MPAFTARRIALLASLLLLCACKSEEKEEPLPTRVEVEQRIQKSGKAEAEKWLRGRITDLRFSSAWHYHRNFKKLMERTRRLHELYLGFFGEEPGAVQVRLDYGHQLFAREQWAEAAEQYEAAIRQAGKKQDAASLKIKVDAAYHALVSHAHLAGLADRPLELPGQTALRQRLLAAAKLQTGPRPEAPLKSKPLDVLLVKAAELETLVPVLPQVEYVLQLTGRAHHLRGETVAAERQLQKLLERKPGALDTWLVTPLLLDCLVRNGKLDQARELARQLLDQPPRQWSPGLLVQWDRELGQKLRETWKPVLEALARPPA